MNELLFSWRMLRRDAGAGELRLLAAALVVLLMVAVRTKVRDAYLAATHAPGPVHTQIGPLVLFLLALVGTLLLVAWMLKIFVQAGARRKEA